MAQTACRFSAFMGAAPIRATRCPACRQLSGFILDPASPALFRFRTAAAECSEQPADGIGGGSLRYNTKFNS